MKIHDVQQNTPEWFALRLGIPTGSKASSLVTPTGRASEAGLKTYAIQLANEKFLGESSSKFTGNQDTDRGNEQEPAAAATYELYNNVKLETVGFCTDDDVRYGVSPDRLISDYAGVEIKCLDHQAHTTALMYYAQNWKVPADRVAQLQMQLYTMGWEYVDLFYYSKKLPCFKIRVLPIKTYFEMLECQIDAVIEERDKVIRTLEAMNG